jgi:hypothetical protein
MWGMTSGALPQLGYPIAQHTLANGLRVISSPDHIAPSVAVNIWYDVGSRNEEQGRTGFAHLFEHVMFQGSAHVASGQHIALLQAAGAVVNATTWFDRTNYFETLPTGGLDLALWLEADRMGTLLDALTQENLDTQREVVKEEKRQRYDNVPYGRARFAVALVLLLIALPMALRPVASAPSAALLAAPLVAAAAVAFAYGPAVDPAYEAVAATLGVDEVLAEALDLLATETARASAG